MSETLEIRVYADTTGLFTKEECESENLTDIVVGKDLVEKWLQKEGNGFNSLDEFLDNYTADTTENLVYWLVQNGYDLINEGRPIYKYGMRLRGFSPGCQPMEGYAYRQDDKAGKYWDIIVYNRALTEEEVKQYSLDQLEIQVPV